MLQSMSADISELLEAGKRVLIYAGLLRVSMYIGALYVYVYRSTVFPCV